MALILGMTAAFGGLRTADHVTPLSFGEVFDDGPLRITPRSMTVTDSVVGLGEPSQGCRFVVLDAAIQNDADQAVEFPPAYESNTGVFPCLDLTDHRNSPYAFGLEGIPSSFAGAVRIRDERLYRAAEPGFTEDFRLVWLVEQAALVGRPTVSIVMPKMERFISTLIIADKWGADAQRFARLNVQLEDR